MTVKRCEECNKPADETLCSGCLMDCRALARAARGLRGDWEKEEFEDLAGRKAIIYTKFVPNPDTIIDAAISPPRFTIEDLGDLFRAKCGNHYAHGRTQNDAVGSLCVDEGLVVVEWEQAPTPRAWLSRIERGGMHVTVTPHDYSDPTP